MRLLPFDYAARNAGRNPVRSILMTLGVAAVVFLVILMGSFVQSMAATMRSTGEPLNVMIVGLGSEDFVEQSEISAAVPSIVTAAVDSIATMHGKPLASPEIMHSAIIALPGHTISEEAHKILVRGITDAAFLVHPQIFITEGNAPGAGEILVGNLAATRLNVPEEALAVGNKLTFENQTWTISGRFSAPGTAFDAEIWAPLEELKIQTKRTTYSTVVVRLKSAKDFSDIDFFTKQRLDLELAAVKEVVYYEGLAQFFKPVQIMGWIMAVLIVISGLFGGLNVMIAAIAGRTKELACLETLGYSRRAIVVALLQESLLQAGTGTLLSVLLASVLLHGSAVRFTMGAVQLEMTPVVLAAGMVSGLSLALFGTLIPAMRFARRPLIDQLR
jgi:putative ABC transport system permease protein